MYVAKGDRVQFNCSLTSSANVTYRVQSLNLSDVTIRRLSTGEVLSGLVRVIGDVAQVTLDTPARCSDSGNVYCSLVDVTGNTIVNSPATHIYVLSQYSKQQTVTEYFFTARAAVILVESLFYRQWFNYRHADPAIPVK